MIIAAVIIAFTLLMIFTGRGEALWTGVKGLMWLGLGLFVLFLFFLFVALMVK